MMYLIFFIKHILTMWKVANLAHRETVRLFVIVHAIRTRWKTGYFLNIVVHILCFNCLLSNATFLMISEDKRIVQVSHHFDKRYEYELSKNNPHVDFLALQQRGPYSHVAANLYIVGYDTTNKELLLFESHDYVSFTCHVVPVQIDHEKEHCLVHATLGILKSGIAVAGLVQYFDTLEQTSKKLNSFFTLGREDPDNQKMLWIDGMPSLRRCNPSMSNPLILNTVVEKNSVYSCVVDGGQQDGQLTFDKIAVYSSDSELVELNKHDTDMDMLFFQANVDLAGSFLVDQEDECSPCSFLLQKKGAGCMSTSIGESLAVISDNSNYDFFPEITISKKKRHIFFVKEKDSGEYAIVTSSSEAFVDTVDTIRRIKKVHTVKLPEESHGIKGCFVYLKNHSFMFFLTSKGADGKSNPAIVLQSDSDGDSWKSVAGTTFPQGTTAVYYLHEKELKERRSMPFEEETDTTTATLRWERESSPMLTAFRTYTEVLQRENSNDNSWTSARVTLPQGTDEKGLKERSMHFKKETGATTFTPVFPWERENSATLTAFRTYTEKNTNKWLLKYKD